jgi:RNA polymerase sigma factor (sigma-70 family)
MGSIEADEFERQRSHLFALAYRMLGSAAEAEDVVQDAWLRSSTAETVNVRSPRAYLMTVVTRLALDRLKSARATREQYIGPWLPEPVLTDRRPEPEESVALAESLTLAFMVLLDTLSPEERAVFVLREVLEYSYAEIAPMLNSTEANCRQLFHRAKERLRSGQSRSAGSRQQKRELAERFVGAMRAGDGDELTRVLAADVGFGVMAADGSLPRGVRSSAETRSFNCCSAFGSGLRRTATRGTGAKSRSSRSTTTRRCWCTRTAASTPSSSVRSRATQSPAFVSSATLTSWRTSLAS